MNQRAADVSSADPFKPFQVRVIFRRDAGSTLSWFMGSLQSRERARIGTMNQRAADVSSADPFILLQARVIFRRDAGSTLGWFMESPLFLSDLLTAHEPDRVRPVLRCREQCGRLDPLVPCARWRDWFRWWITAHFGEARVGFPVGKICLLSELHRASGVGPNWML
jgi:hypothetical protein